MSARDAELRINATRAAAEEIARGHGDDDVAEAAADHLLTYGPGDLTLCELRKIAADAFKMATAAARQSRGAPVAPHDARRGPVRGRRFVVKGGAAYACQEPLDDSAR